MVFSDGALLVLKLAAFLVMVLDHVDWLLGTGQGVHAGVGRLVYPVFGTVLAYNIARTSPAKLLEVVGPRLLAFGALAQLPYAYLQGGWLPGNILLTLALVVFAFALVEAGRILAASFLVLVLGAVVDYQWFGVVPVVFLALAFRHGDERCAVLAMFGFALALTPINGNVWALLAVPLLWFASRVPPAAAPRLRWLFWVGYPLHLVALALFKAL